MPLNLDAYKRRERHNVTESTLKSRVSALKNFEEFVDDDPSPEDVEAWIDHMIDEYERGNVKSGTIKQYFKAVKYYWQKVEGDSEPIEHVRDWIPTGDTDHGDFLRMEEWNTLRNTATSLRERAILELMYYYARRPGEIILLNMDDITMSNESDEPTITFNILKKDEPFRATFELREDVEDILKTYFKYRSDVTIPAEHEWENSDDVEPVFTTSHGRISYDTVWRNIKGIAQAAGINKNITPKSLRHSRTTHLDWSGQSPDVISRQQLIHDPDSNVVGHYVHSRDEEDVREVMTLDGE